MKEKNGKPGSFLQKQIQKEIEKSRANISKLRESKNKLQEKDRLLHKRGMKLVQTADRQIDEIRKNIEDTENRLTGEEKKYSAFMSGKSVLKKALVNLSEQELQDLQKLSKDYRAFEKYLSAGLKAEYAKYKEICPWNACWTCTDVCGGCTGCGQACSQINACIARPTH